ncbi:hypothetical protein OAP14_02475 [Aliiglaciecola sp.]|nr:hypothetical protein [Aliiglaciecola sp.]
MSDEEVQLLAKQLESDLLKLYGSPVISGGELQRALGYRTKDGLRQAILRNTLPVKVFQIPKRRGYFALIKDVANYLAQRARDK